MSPTLRSTVKKTPVASAVTMDELNRSIGEIRSSQIEMLAECKAMNQYQASKLSELITSIDSLKSQIFEVRSENTSLRLDINSLNNRIKTLENSTEDSNSMPQLIQELADRERCSRNIIVHGLQESPANDPTVRIASDTKLLADTIQPCNLSLPSDSKLFRLGHKVRGKPRPLKIILSSKEVALNFLTVFNTYKRTLSPPTDTISISRDRTLLERQEIRRVYNELDDRRKKGDHNVSIRYRSGVPFLVLNETAGPGNLSHQTSSSHSKN